MPGYCQMGWGIIVVAKTLNIDIFSVFGSRGNGTCPFVSPYVVIAMPCIIHHNSVGDGPFTKVRCTNSTRRNYFSQIIINDWNGLPTSAILATSINIF